MTDDGLVFDPLSGQRLNKFLFLYFIFKGLSKHRLCPVRSRVFQLVIDKPKASGIIWKGMS